MCMNEKAYQLPNLRYPVRSMTQLNMTMWSMVIDCPAVAAKAKEGQFVHLLPDGNYTLRRPISICGIDKEAGTLRLVFEVRGEGTKTLSQLKAGDTVDLLGPLGHGFTLLDNSAAVVMIGGGIGTPPMLPLAQHYGKNGTVICGFRNQGAAILQNDFIAAGTETILCTDDGSAGHHGLVTEPLAKLLQEKKVDIIYACGPMPMLRAVAALAKENGVRCEVSLEERMGCGVGACLVCACNLYLEDGSIHAGHVCKDGPVFDAERVVWNG